MLAKPYFFLEKEEEIRCFVCVCVFSFSTKNIYLISLLSGAMSYGVTGLGQV